MLSVVFPVFVRYFQSFGSLVMLLFVGLIGCNLFTVMRFVKGSSTAEVNFERLIDECFEDEGLGIRTENERKRKRLLVIQDYFIS